MTGAPGPQVTPAPEARVHRAAVARRDQPAIAFSARRTQYDVP